MFKDFCKVNSKLTSRVSCTPALIPNHSTVLLANSRSVINEIRFAIMWTTIIIEEVAPNEKAWIADVSPL